MMFPRVVFLVDGEQTGIGYLGVLVNGDILFALKEREGLEGGRGVHPSVAAASKAALFYSLRSPF